MFDEKYNFVDALWLAESQQFLPARVVNATAAHADWWFKNVQRFIFQDESRPDRNWDWRSLIAGKSPFIRLAQWIGQQPQAFCITVSDSDGNEIPIAMLLLVKNYVYLPDTKQGASFIWFLAAAPEQVLRDKLDGKKPSLLRALIDIGVVVSFRASYDGKMGLHADPSGGASLVDKYMACGLKKMPDERHLPWSRRLMQHLTATEGSIGCYLYADNAIALANMRKLKKGG
jgi:hypothetical protein